MSNITDLSPEQLRSAANVKEQIVRLEKQLLAIVGGNGAATAVANPAAKGRRGPSPEAIERIRAAQKARWAKIRAQKGGAKAPSKPAKRTLSPQAIEKIRAAAKARWARVRAGKGK